MKKIKVKFAGFWPGFDLETFPVYQVMKKYYDVEITDDADYVICSLFRCHEYVNYPQVRILFSGENLVPDFNLADYAISVYPVQFLDRHFSFPGVIGSVEEFLALKEKDRNYPDEILRDKPFFANFIFSHNSENGVRKELFDLLSQYKRIESLGPFLYNMPNGETVSRADSSKLEFQRKTKFTLCCESTCHEGFITEKIIEAFCADTIPVYYGSATVSEIINKKAFINIADYSSLQEVVDRIIELDTDDEKYLEVLREPIFVNPNYVEEKMTELERFVCNIFDQPLEKAYRRSRVYVSRSYEKTFKKGADIQRKLDLLSNGSREVVRSTWNAVRGFLKKLLGETGYERIKGILKGK